MFILSSQQQHILKWLMNRTRFAEQQKPQLLEKGFDWMPQWKSKCEDQAEDKALENVWRASLCRSLARLERRKLIIRIKGRKRARTTRVLLTSKGRKVAETISGN